MVLQEYPNQALWLFMSVVKSTKSLREQRGNKILDQLRVSPYYHCAILIITGMLQNIPGNENTNIADLIKKTTAMTNELLALCDYQITDESRKALTIAKDFPRLAALGRSRLLIPLQESLNANLPPNSSSGSEHQPFPLNAPLFESKSCSSLRCVVAKLKHRILR